MHIHRRQFLKYCVGSAAALGLPLNVIGKLEEALAADANTLPKVIWLNAANCTGCTVSLANLIGETGPTDVADLLINTIDLTFHPTLMAAAGDLAVQQLQTAAQGSYILAVEGGIPTAFNGHACILWSENGRDVTAMEAVQALAPNAAAVLSIGTCASFGGVPSTSPNPTGVVDVGQLTGINTVNIPGCPAHPDWIVWTIANLLAGQTLTLDDRRRPTALYGRTVHDRCPRREQEEVRTFGVNGCLEELGCKGPVTRADCPSRRWNGGTNWCIGAGGLCIGCTHQGFPESFNPIYRLAYNYQLFEKAPENPTDPQPQPQPEPQPEPPTAAALTIKKAEWWKKGSRLGVEGTAESGAIVTIINADTGDQFGAVSVNGNGGWRFEQQVPKPQVPQRVRATSSDGQTVMANVTAK